jgi:hypothetical protein
MSLIVSTSKLEENTSNISSENPSNFTNFFRSPIKIAPNSEIAVESVKINRTPNVHIKSNSYFCHYFGQKNDESDDKPYQIEAPRRIQLDEGTYNLDEYKNQLASKLNKCYGHPSIFANASVDINTTATGEEAGLKIKFVQRDSGSGTNITNQLEHTPYYNLQRPNQNNGSQSDGFTWTAASGVFNRTAANENSLNNTEAVGILTGRPFSNQGGRMTVTVNNASATYWKVGLSRPHVQYEVQEGASRVVENLYPHGYETKYNYRYHTGVTQSRGKEHYDYVVECKTGTGTNDGLRMFCSMNRKEPTLTSSWKMYEMKYWESGGAHSGGVMTASAFYASYDRIRFESDGTYISVFAGQKGKSVYDQLMGPNLSKEPAECFKPIGDTTYALYPQFNIGSGDLLMSQYESEYGGDSSYLFPVYNATDAQVGTAGPRQFVPGSDFYSTNRISSSDKFNIVNGRQITLFRNVNNVITEPGGVATIDGSLTYLNYFSVGALLAYFQPHGLNASEGVLLDHVLIANKYTIPQIEDYLLNRQRFPNMSLALGYRDRAILSQDQGSIDGYVSGSGTNTVIFTSPNEIEKAPISAFVRIPNLTHQSFNGGQSGMSKILYQVPQFSNDGRQYGPLYFAPGEKTYIDLKNPTETILNQLQVQLVGADEKELQSLNGTTQVVFHVRPKRA